MSRAKLFAPHAVLLLAFTILLGSGCASIDAGADPVIVNAQRTQAASFAVVNQFIQFDHENRALLAAKAPAVHQTAETIRADAPLAFQTLDQALAAYKASRTAEDGQRVDDMLVVVQDLARRARLALLEAQKAKSP